MSTLVAPSRGGRRGGCRPLSPVALKELKIEKEIEKRCEEHFKKYSKRLDEIERKLEDKVEFGDVVALINEKSEKDKEKIVEDQLKEKQIIDLVKQVQTKSVPDIVRKRLQESNISEQNVNKLVDHKIDEIDKHIDSIMPDLMRLLICFWSYIRKNVSLLTVMFAADLKLMICSWMILDGIIYSLIAWS